MLWTASKESSWATCRTSWANSSSRSGAIPAEFFGRHRRPGSPAVFPLHHQVEQDRIQFAHASTSTGRLVE